MRHPVVFETPAQARVCGGRCARRPGRPGEVTRLTASQPSVVSRQDWDWHWQRVSLPRRVRAWNPGVVFTKRLLRRALPRRGGRTFEVGCAPGAWLAWLGTRPQLEIAGCDASPRGVRATRDNLRALGVPAHVRESDVFDLAGAIDADLVYSLGVVEHFDDLDAIVAAHASVCRAGGRVVLTAPNLRGVSGRIFRRAMPNLFEGHRVVTPEALRRAAAACELEPRTCGYRGPLSAFVLCEVRRSRIARAVAYGFALVLGFLTLAARSEVLAGSVVLDARKRA